MPTRRATLGILAIAAFYDLASAQAVDPVEAEIQNWVNDPDFNRGSLILPPSHEAVRAAAEFLDQAPRGGRPIGIVRWLIANIPPGKLEWPPDTRTQRNPANPVIVSFFSATRLSIPPAGDETHWCAALACWALRRAGLPHPNSAASASFRQWGTATTDPADGDIVVFRNKYDNNFGHVGFFSGYNNLQELNVLGGNQSDRINRTSFPQDGQRLALHSFRTASGYR